MSDTKLKEEALINILIKKGYEKDSAIKCVQDVLDARVEMRENLMKEYVGKRVKAEFGGLLFEVIVKDIKINNEGKTEFQVTPLNGSKCVWINKFSLN